MNMKRSKRAWFWIFGGIIIAILAVVLVILGISVVSALLQAKKINSAVSTDLTAAQLASVAQQQQQNGDLAGAELSLEQAMIKESKPDYESQLAVVKYRLKKYSDAIAEYQKLIAAKQDPAFAWNGIGNAYRDWALQDTSSRLDRQAKAIDAYKQALVADPAYLASYTNQVLLLKDMGRISDALSVAKDGYSKTQRKELQDLISQLQ